LGFIAAGHFTDKSKLAQLEEQIEIFRSKAPEGAPLCVGFIAYSTFQTDEGWQCYETVLKKHQPSVVQFFAPAVCVKDGKSNIEIAHEHSAKVLGQVGNVAEGRQAIAAGVDGIIAQGSEAGGHGLRRELGSGTLSLAARLVTLAKESPQKPLVLAAGGIVDGRGVAAAFALGCDGAVLGTRLWASNEALNKSSLKDQLVLADSCDLVHRTRVFDQVNNKQMSTPWPSPYDSVGALRNDLSEKWDGRADDLETELLREGSTLLEDFQSASQQADTSMAQVLAGEGVGEIEAIEPAYDIVSRIDQEAQEVIHNLSSLI
jgi:nitronate monooxygenase